MRPDRRLEDLAQLAVRVGVNVQPGQRLAINALVEHREFVRVAAAEAYRAGAQYVDVLYTDNHVRHSQVALAGDEDLGWSPPWLIERMQALVRDGGALLSINGNPEPNLFADLDGARVGRSQMRELRAATLRVTDGRCNWSIVSYPTPGWAQAVFGEPDVERLWRAVEAAVRLDEPDPISAWEEHLARLNARAAALDARRFDAIRYVGPGTDLVVGLHEDGAWLAADEWVRDIRHVPNMPTEEVFTSPDARRVDGVVRATYPLVLQGTIVRGLELEFANGRVTRVHATEGEDLVRAHVALDDGAARLGEIAIVDGDSRVGRSGIVFLDTLFDENAASHIALGAAYVSTDELRALAAEERHARGYNDSSIHTDFMIGSNEVDVFGIDEGAETPILRAGEWVLS